MNSSPTDFKPPDDLREIGRAAWRAAYASGRATGRWGAIGRPTMLEMFARLMEKYVALVRCGNDPIEAEESRQLLRTMAREDWGALIAPSTPLSEVPSGLDPDLARIAGLEP